MSQLSFHERFFKILLRNFLFLGSAFSFYLFDAQTWAFCLVPFFLILLKDTDQLPTLSLFCILLLQDIATGYWVGTHLFLYGLTGVFIVSQKRFILSRGFVLIWIFFTLTVFLTLGLRELLGLIANVPLHSFLSLLYEASFLCCVFPLCSHFLTRYLSFKKVPSHEA